MVYRNDYERDYNRRKVKIWYEKNKEFIKENRKKYREANKEKLAKRRADYYAKNKKSILNNRKKWYNEHKDKYKQTVSCECGCTFTRKYKPEHLKTKIHQQYINKPTLKQLLDPAYIDKVINEYFD